MIQYYKRTINQKIIEQIDDFKVGCWINVVDPSETEILELCKERKLDIDLLNDGLDQNELPRIEKYENNTYIYVKTINKEKKNLNTLLIILEENCIITFSKEKIEVLNQLISGKKEITTTQRNKSLIVILKLINDEIEKETMAVVKNVQSTNISKKNLKEKDLETLLIYEDFFNSLVSMYTYTAILYTKMTKMISFYENDKDILDELIVDSEQIQNMCKNSLKTISNITRFHSIILTNRLNNTIKILTILTIVISIPNVFSSFYGMNIPLPWQNNPFAYIYIIISIVLVSVIFILYLRKKEILY